MTTVSASTETKPGMPVSLVITLENGRTYALVILNQKDLDSHLTTEMIMEEAGRCGLPQVSTEDALAIANHVSTDDMTSLGLHELVVMQKVLMGNEDRFPGVGRNYQGKRYTQTFNARSGVIWNRQGLVRGDRGFVFLAPNQ